MADFECYLKPVDGNTAKRNTNRLTHHKPCAAALKVSSRFAEWDLPVESFLGEDCINKFLDRLVEIAEEAQPLLETNIAMIKPDPQRLKIMQQKTTCAICGDPFGTEAKHLDHDHFDGKCLGYTHQRCNMERRKPKFIPVIFHNLKGYVMCY